MVRIQACSPLQIDGCFTDLPPTRSSGNEVLMGIRTPIRRFRCKQTNSELAQVWRCRSGCQQTRKPVGDPAGTSRCGTPSLVSVSLQVLTRRTRVWEETAALWARSGNKEMKTETSSHQERRWKDAGRSLSGRTCCDWSVISQELRSHHRKSDAHKSDMKELETWYLHLFTTADGADGRWMLRRRMWRHLLCRTFILK